MHTGAMRHRHFRHTGALPLCHHRNKAMEIPVKIDEADDRGAVQFNAAVEVVQTLAAYRRNRQIEKLRRPSLVPRIVATHLPTRQVIAFVENLHHLRNFTRIVLQISVKRSDQFATSLGETERKGICLSTVELETEQSKEIILFCKFQQNIPRTISTSIIDDNHFKRLARRSDGIHNFFHQFRKIFFFFLDWNYKTQIHTCFLKPD